MLFLDGGAAEVYDEFGDEGKVHQHFTANRQTRVLTFQDLDSNEPEQTITLDGGRMSKLLRWAVHTLEIFMWDEDYCSHSSEYDYDPYAPDWDDEGPDGLDFMEAPEIAEPPELDSAETTWQVQISYSNGEQQDIRCADEYLPDRAEELRWRMLEYFENEDE